MQKKQCNWRCAACGGQYDWRNPHGVLVIQDSTDRREAKVFRAQAPPNGVCQNLVCTLELLAKPSRWRVIARARARGKSSRGKQIEDCGGAPKVHHGGQPRGGENGRLGKALGGAPRSRRAS